jgi:hypothetical protein
LATSQDKQRKLAGEFEVSPDKPWIDTSMELLAGDRVEITSQGALTYATSQAGPNGLPRTWGDLVRALPVNDAGAGALIGRVGSEVAAPFLIGASKQITSTLNGHLYLGVNQSAADTGSGSYRVKVQIVPAEVAAKAAVKPLVAPNGVLDRIPRRVRDSGGGDGDMVNFLLIGSADKVQQAFKSAGWVLVDRTKQDAVLHALLSSTSKQVYLEMPMSELYLFGRTQDYGFAHAEPLQVVASRHHLRLWKAPFMVDGQPVWAGAATHDIGFERDMRSPNAITHKIDPEVDKEREFVEQTLTATGLISGTTYVLPSNPVQEAHTATGGSFHSDGRVLVLAIR